MATPEPRIPPLERVVAQLERIQNLTEVLKEEVGLLVEDRKKKLAALQEQVKEQAGA